MSGFKPNFQQTEFVNVDLTIQRRWFASKWMSFVSDTPLTRTNSSRNRQLIGMTTDMRLLLLHTFYLIFQMSNYQPFLFVLLLKIASTMCNSSKGSAFMLAWQPQKSEKCQKNDFMFKVWLCRQM